MLMCLSHPSQIAPQVALTLLCINLIDKARYEAEYRFFELLVNMVNTENVVNVVNIIEAGEEKMICVRDI